MNRFNLHRNIAYLLRLPGKVVCTTVYNSVGVEPSTPRLRGNASYALITKGTWPFSAHQPSETWAPSPRRLCPIDNMLPLPGSPASSWAMYRARLAAIFRGADPRVCTAFWLFGKHSSHCWRAENHSNLTLRLEQVSSTMFFMSSSFPPPSILSVHQCPRVSCFSAMSYPLSS